MGALVVVAAVAPAVVLAVPLVLVLVVALRIVLVLGSILISILDPFRGPFEVILGIMLRSRNRSIWDRFGGPKRGPFWDPFISILCTNVPTGSTFWKPFLTWNGKGVERN